MSQLLILFGKSGVGKDFVARLFEREFGYDWYDADQDLTPEMMQAMKHQLEFTAAMRARYFDLVQLRLNQLLQAKEKVAVTQGLFKNKNRHDLRKANPLAAWIWVDAAENIITARVLQRNNIVTPEYAGKINQYFEEPDFPCYKILNNRGVTDILSQARLIEKELNATPLPLRKERDERRSD